VYDDHYGIVVPRAFSHAVPRSQPVRLAIIHPTTMGIASHDFIPCSTPSASLSARRRATTLARLSHHLLRHTLMPPGA
jgi:hypothetical protein